MTIKMTEQQAMIELIGRPVTVTQRTHTGSRVIVGEITTPLEIVEIGGEEAVRLVSIEGTVTAEFIDGLSLPIEPDRAIKMTLIPISEVEMIR